MTPRDPEQPHRAATPLELFFDLCFVVAIALAADNLHHGLVEDHVEDEHPALLSRLLCDLVGVDELHLVRLGLRRRRRALPRSRRFVQMAGALIIAAGVPRTFETGDFDDHGRWLRHPARRAWSASGCVPPAGVDGPLRATAQRYAVGLVVHPGGLGRRPCSSPSMAASSRSCLWSPLELLRAQSGRKPRMPCTLAGTPATSPSATASSPSSSSASLSWRRPLGLPGRARRRPLDEFDLITLAIAALVLIFSCWWLYFDRQRHDRLTTLKYAFTWGYGHWFIFASLAAVGAGIAATVDYKTDHSALNAVETGYAVAIPAADLTCSASGRFRSVPFEAAQVSVLFLIAAVLVLLAPLLGLGLYPVAIIMVALVAVDLKLRPVVAEAALHEEV